MGIDIVSDAERGARDMAAVARDGFAAWVDIYAEVFSARELEEMKRTLPAPVVVPVRHRNSEGKGENDGAGGRENVTLSPTDLAPLARC